MRNSLNVDFSIVVLDDALLVDDLCCAASKGMVEVIRDEYLLKELGFGILTFDVLFFGSTRIDYRFVNVSMRAEATSVIKNIEEKIDELISAVMATMAAELKVSADVFADTFENGSVGISGGALSSKEPSGVWPEGNDWRREDYRWDASDSNEAVAYIEAGESREAAIQLVEERKERQREDAKRSPMPKEPESIKKSFWERVLKG